MVFESVEDIISFQDDEVSILRGTGLNRIIQQRAVLYSNSSGSTSTYAFSRQVKTLRYFISHNWVVSRYSKFFTLSLYFNLTYGIIGTTIVAIFFATFNVVYSNDERLWCQICCPLVFLVTFTFASDFKAMMKLAGPLCFLDKTCIHQEDEQLKRAGIGKLGAFVHSSDQFIAILSDMYLRKLWTVYELACCLIVKETSSLVVLPVYKARVFMGAITILVLNAIVTSLVNMYGVESVAIRSCTMLGFTVSSYVVLARIWKRKMEVMRQLITSFSVREAQCAVSSDKLHVLANIMRLLRATRMVPEEASDDEVLDEFDKHVRQNFLVALDATLGKYLFKYKESAFLSFLIFTPNYVDARAAAWRTGTTRQAFIPLVCTIGNCLALGPLIMPQIDVFVGSNIHLRGWREVCYVMLGVMIAFATCAVHLILLLTCLETRYLPDPVACALFALYEVVVYVGRPWILSCWARTLRCRLSHVEKSGRKPDTRDVETCSL